MLHSLRAFSYAGEADIFREYARLSGIAGGFGLDFDISALRDLSDADYAALAPTRWPVSDTKQGGRFFADGKFYHPDGKARLVATAYREPAARTGRRYPFRLNTGRIRDQWHTMTRTGLSPRLSAHLAEPFLEIHPTDAQDLGIAPADLVQARSPNGEAILRARITDSVQRGQVFAPMHWTGENAPTARVDDLVAPVYDPISGQPESKASVVALHRFDAKWYGFAVSSQPMRPDCAYWAHVPSRKGYRAELAGRSEISDWENTALRLFGLEDVSLSSIVDNARGIARIALTRDEQLLAALFVAPEPVAVSRDYLATLPTSAVPTVLSGRVPADVPDPGPVLCSCFSVGVNTIVDAIETQHLFSVDAIGAALQAGSNCGSCRPEIAALIQTRRSQEAAE
ncbi:molybdopterin dinucleotide binding domain-containing protein [Celeribacter indicus]|uniref:Assimilatory nitrate reductase (NADH) subunit alpha apoprotein n=1 Tax=Celeribacter indicus TaxID=1208324 RepID=A0A0B5E123_9RHOB|nr:assimilatory nitrate reductase (NADH) subunit alpha apoprotein [Celeribacter indicus]SDX54086.1 assimilatory nitrate reductase catalytic subunit [Celeribacter indicus]